MNFDLLIYENNFEISLLIRKYEEVEFHILAAQVDSINSVHMKDIVCCVCVRMVYNFIFF